MARYIDADALIKKLGINNDCTECSYCTRKYYCSWNPDPGEVCIAISEQPTVTINDTAEEIKVTNCNDNDLISRQDALSCFHDWIDKYGDVHTAAEMPEYQRIEQLPSAQPDVIRCKDCRFQDKGRNESESWNLCGYRPWSHVPTEDEHYCGYAERRTDDCV